MTGTYTSQTNQTQSTAKSGQTAKKSPCGCGGSGSATQGGTGGCGCGCSGTPCSGEPCCTDVCFERPNYFCGHLLTDDDLTSGQRYFREKNKLYHRALHGSGIVCGLGMKRDLDCPGNILIGEGFAIDACGNDLVVCEQQSFNLISALNRKGYLVTETPDPCEDQTDDDCHIKQCFWIAARYSEDPTDFESPLQSACSPGPTSCEPTRIQESVKFDVLDQAPEHHNPLEQLIARFECCFRVLTEGNFANTVKANSALLGGLFSDQTQGSAKAADSYNPPYYNVFCQLKAYFLQHIRRFPDPYDAQLENKLQAELPPDQPNSTRQQQVTPQDAFCRLFGRVWSYISNCLYSAMVFPCPAPKCGGEVILGTVEIENGKLARICHCGRSYVWSAANFWQALVAYLVETKTCQQQPAAETQKNPAPGHCCPDIDLNCQKFFDLYLLDQKAPQLAILDTLGLLTGLTSAVKTSFNFFDPNVVPPSVFKTLNANDAQALASKVGLTLNVTDSPTPTPISPFADVLTRMLARPGDTITAAVSNNLLVPVMTSPATTAMRAQLTDTQKAVEAATTQIQQISANAAKATDLEAANAQIQQLTQALQARDGTLATLNTQLNGLISRVAVLEKPAAPPAGQGS